MSDLNGDKGRKNEGFNEDPEYTPNGTTVSAENLCSLNEK